MWIDSFHGIHPLGHIRASFFRGSCALLCALGHSLFHVGHSLGSARAGVVRCTFLLRSFLGIEVGTLLVFTG
jgi:hypothetical protein